MSPLILFVAAKRFLTPSPLPSPLSGQVVSLAGGRGGLGTFFLILKAIWIYASDYGIRKPHVKVRLRQHGFTHNATPLASVNSYSHGVVDLGRGTMSAGRCGLIF